MHKYLAAFVVAGTMTAGAAFADEQGGPMMMADSEMDNVIGGVVLATMLRTGAIVDETPDGDPVHKTIDMTGKGPKKLLAGEGPDNNGVTAFQDFDLQTNPPSPPGLFTVDGSLVGAPSNGRGAGFFVINLNI